MRRNKAAAIILLCSLFLIGCKSFPKDKIDYVVIYKTSNQNPNIEPHYLILKAKPKTSERYMPTQYTSVFGEWSYLGDTIYVKPLYIYDLASSNPPLKDVNAVDSSVISIPQKYIVKGNILIDVTDYSIVHPVLKGRKYQEQFKRIK